MVKTEILGVSITNETEDNILEYVLKTLRNRGENYYIVTPNPEIIVYSKKDKQFKTIINQARLALCDGTGVLLAGLVLGKKIKQRITGVDFMVNLCKRVSEENIQHARKPITVGFLGAGPKIAERTAECLESKYPGVKIVFLAEEWGEEGFIRASQRSKVKDQKSKPQLKSKNSSEKKQLYPKPYTLNAIDILFVAFGFPKQEIWMAGHINHLPVRVMIGVGGAFDYVSGNVSRAPFIVRLFGFEWLYRLVREPWRIRRQLAILKFVCLVIKERFS
ncbi:WecB/TagA/CpsF family glycosyltransferase [Patescibacteria group bacterium]|nr:WecB/TagA/CpsF family glycosyltransferase [Patescibacteria group bacterium]MCL5010254.1 WecB/TagA/CpsF family glycosyltransferase [Patescibacteria group bacterium]